MYVFFGKRTNFTVNVDISASHLSKTKVECRGYDRGYDRTTAGTTAGTTKAVICVLASGSCQHFESISKVLLLR